jgi:hypothetical protein
MATHRFLRLAFAVALLSLSLRIFPALGEKNKPEIAGTLADNYLIVDLYAGGGFRARDTQGRWITFPGDTHMLSMRIGREEYVLYPNMDLRAKVSEPVSIVGNVAQMTWLVDGVRVQQKLTLMTGIVFISFEVTNLEGLGKNIGVRLLLDLQVEWNDGATVYVEGYGLVTKETAFSFPGNLTFDKWWTQGSLNSDFKALCRFPTTPSKVSFAYWWTARNTVFDYMLDPTRPPFQPYPGTFPESDTCALIYFDLGLLLPNRSRTSQITYGLF